MRKNDALPSGFSFSLVLTFLNHDFYHDAILRSPIRNPTLIEPQRSLFSLYSARCCLVHVITTGSSNSLLLNHNLDAFGRTVRSSSDGRQRATFVSSTKSREKSRRTIREEVDDNAGVRMRLCHTQHVAHVLFVEK